MRQWSISLGIILLGVTIICAGCKSRPTRPVDDPADNSVGAETSIYENVEHVEVVDDQSGTTGRRIHGD